MKTKTLLLISTFLTVFTLVIIAGVVKAIYYKPAPSQAEGSNPQLEAAYAELAQQASTQIEQANQRIEQANKEIANMEVQVQQAKAASQSSENKINPQMAVVTASKEVGRSGIVQQEAQLVQFEGKVAYEVVFDNGKVYIDANSGQVLSNSVPKLIDQEEAAKIASEYLKNAKVFRVDLTTLKNVPVYKVLFNVGHVVFVDTHGQIVLVQKVSYNAVTVSNNQGGGSAPVSAKSSEHESEHDDD